jgi:hypothetical protein
MSFIDHLIDGSFAGVSFMEEFKSGYTTGIDLISKDALIEVPGGNNAYLQDFGQAARPFTKDVFMTSAQHSAMEAKRMVNGTLVSYSGNVTARLRNIRNVRVSGHDLGIIAATLEFLRS